MSKKAIVKIAINWIVILIMVGIISLAGPIVEFFLMLQAEGEIPMFLYWIATVFVIGVSVVFFFSGLLFMCKFNSPEMYKRLMKDTKGMRNALGFFVKEDKDDNKSTSS